MGNDKPFYNKTTILKKFGINLYQSSQNYNPPSYASLTADKRRLLEETVCTSTLNTNSSQSRDMWKDKREIWTWLVTLFTATIIVFVGRMSMPICEVEIAEEFDWDEERLGKVMSVFFWGYAVTQIPGGAAADIFGGATTISFSLFMWGTICWATPMLTLSTRQFFGNSMAYLVLFILRIFMGLAQAIHFPSLSSILSRKMTDSGRAFAMSFVCCGSQFGTLLTGYFGSKLLEITNWKTVFVFAGMLHSAPEVKICTR